MKVMPLIGFVGPKIEYKLKGKTATFWGNKQYPIYNAVHSQKHKIQI